MKVQCDVCEKAAATLLCCADEAALCGECDKQVHAANKLAEKHERVPLIGSKHPSSCDICQEKSGHFFCVEDRALLCRECDVSIHTTNMLVRRHKRFLVSGVQVGLHAATAPPPLLVCESPKATTMENTQQMVPNAQQVIWPTSPPPPPPPPPLVVCKANYNSMGNIHAAPMQTFKPHALTWPKSPLIPPTPPSHSQHFPSPPSTNSLVTLDELLNINTTTAYTLTDTPSSKMTIPDVGWGLPNNTPLAWDHVLNASTFLFEDSLAEVPSVQSSSIQDLDSLKRKRPLHELTYSTFDHSTIVPNNIFPCFKERKTGFSGGIGG